MKRLQRRFEGQELLKELLALTGSSCSFDEVVERFREGVRAGTPAGEVIPTLYDGPPCFTDPSHAPQLFGNLLALWDLVAEGRPIPSGIPLGPRDEPEPSAPPSRVKAQPPSPFAPGEPDGAFGQSVRGYLDAASPKELERLEHAFENREDSLLGRLDELALSDQGYGQARDACFELFALMQLGWPAGTRPTPRGALEDPRDGEVPSPNELPSAFRDLLEALGASDSAARAVVTRYAKALWTGRR